MKIDNKFTIQHSFVINAGAGSGKTYTLSRRYINALLGFDFFIENNTQKHYYENLNPAEVEEIVTLTYTEAAALEMKERIFSLLKKIINFNSLHEYDSDYNSIKLALNSLTQEQKNYVNKKLNKDFKEISNAIISTIHSYCLQIIKKNSDIAKVDTSIDLIKDNEKVNIIDNSIFKVLNDDNNKDDVLELSKYLSLFKINEFVNKYLSDDNFRSHFNEFDSKNEIEYKKLLLDITSPKDIDDTFNFIIDYLNKNIDKFEEHNLSVNSYIDFLKEYYSNFKNFKLEKWSLLSKKYGIKFQFNVKPFTKLKELKPSVDKIKLIEKGDEFTEISLEKEYVFFSSINILKKLLKQIKNLYDEELIGIKKVDFNSIINIAHNIINKIDMKFKYFMVDEFQDTNKIQYDIIKKSLNKNTNFFVVGDSKQSIYSFQGAEIEVFNDTIEDSERFSDIVNMDINFRSDEIILKNINNIFYKLFTKNENIKLIEQNYEANAQNLKISSNQKLNKGSFEYLITTNKDFIEIPEEEREGYSIALFIKMIIEGKNDRYLHIKNLIDNNKKAIAIIFDSKTKMLLFKKVLNKLNINSKVFASENFYQTKEVNDIFNVLKAINIVSNISYSKKNKKAFNDFQKFYLVGAYRSNILRIKDKDIKKYIENSEIPEKLMEYYKESQNLTLSGLIKFIYDDSRLFDVYANFDDLEQRIANLYKFLNLAFEFETNNNNELNNFLRILKESIYFNNINEDEAFYKSLNLESIELCSIHSTKGLAYPMIILAESSKNLEIQSARGVIKHNQFNFLSKNKYESKKMVLLGYKIDDYKPLCFRFLSKLNNIKHMAEKKRLLYVALTRAEHDIIIAGYLKGSKLEVFKNSYLSMIISSLNIKVEDLYTKSIINQLKNIDIDYFNDNQFNNIKNNIEIINFSLDKIEFTNRNKVSATMNKKKLMNKEKAILGTIVHKILQENWSNLSNLNYENIFKKYNIQENTDKIKINLDNFINSDVYNGIKNNKEVYFELEFETEEKHGFIDLLYFDVKRNGWVVVDFKTGIYSKAKEKQYLEQLHFYSNFLNNNKKTVIETKILWL